MAKLVPTVVDLETFFSPTHSLTKMNPIVYCTHPETEIISCAAKVGTAQTCVSFGEEFIKGRLRGFDWSDKICIAHNNAGFDSMILAWRCGVRPALWADTLAMARPHHAKTTGLSLAKLVEHYGIGKKNNAALLNTKGRHLKDFTPDEIEAMRQYNKDDVDQCAALFDILLPLTSKREMKLIDMTIRMLVTPKFVVDTGLLERTLKEEKIRKHEMLLSLANTLGVNEPGMSDKDATDAVRVTLGSAAKFSALLEQLGVKVPTKISPATSKEAPALAKTDEGFIALQEHENPVVAAAAAARLGVKSTILESRIESFLAVSAATKGRMPVPINYYGADTTGRDSGSMNLNMQNLTRILPGAPKLTDALRNCLRAPKGHKVVVADLSGIELRVNMFLWKVPYAMALYQADPEKADLYKTLASEVFRVPFGEVTKMQRQAAKAMALGCGFGLGSAAKFIAVAKQMAQLVVTEEEATWYIASYRQKHPEIVQGWKTCHGALPAIYAGADYQIDPWGLCRTVKGGIETPQGMILYPDLRQETNPPEDGKKARTEWVYGQGRHKSRIYAGKITENCLAAGTQVLTASGWKSIELVSAYDKVHDGVEFVSNGGTIFKSVQPCVSIDGVYMTADHEVLTDEGWKTAGTSPRPLRPSLWGADLHGVRGDRRAPRPLEVPVPVRESYCESGGRCDRRGETGRHPQLRVFDPDADWKGEYDARNVQSSRLRRVAQYDGSVSTSIPPSVEELRRAGDHSVRPLEGSVRELLGRHGPEVPAGDGFGSMGQQRPVLPGELLVGATEDQYVKQTEQPRTGHSHTGSRDRDTEVDAVLPSEAWEVANRSGGQTESYEVYDVLNAGPRHRFVVLGDNGPFIVHNCVQHLAREVVMDNALRIKKDLGLSTAHRVHDELIYVVPESEADDTLAAVQSIMRTPPIWWPSLVVWSEGSTGDTYGEAK